MSNLEIGGLLPFTTIDFPGKLACVLFLQGCPLRCKYCSNPDLLEFKQGKYDPEKILGFLKKRIGKLEAVVFSGGEALMQGDSLIDYIKQIRKLGFAIGIHTNGFYPDVLKKILPLIDWVGLDFKASQKNYKNLTGSDTAAQLAIQSLDILLEWSIESANRKLSGKKSVDRKLFGRKFECRTTADPRFISKKDLLEVASFLSKRGVKHYAVQKYQPHFEKESEQTTEADRGQFFTDPKLRKQIEKLFETVTWRE